MLNSFKSNLSRCITNARGWRTTRKIVVIESDDWGSIRMPNKQVQETYENLGYSIKNNAYCRFDTLANSEDFEVLFETLSKFKDSKGNHPIITLNTVMANPDFNKISGAAFREYFYEPFTETLKRYYPKENVFQLWKEGIRSDLVKPQFHGREHVNVPIWLKQLKSNNTPLIDAFNLGFWGIPESHYSPKRLNIQASYDSNLKEHVAFYKQSISEGLELFEKTFKFKSTTFIANNYTWPSELNTILYDNGVRGFQSMKYQKLPLDVNERKRVKKEVYTGKMNDLGQTYLVRNCIFEPSNFKPHFDNVGTCLKHIEQAFFFKKPAIITSHRLNFIGSLCEENRKNNIQDLNILLQSVSKKWPDVEFLSSDQLLDIVNK